jgi:hypothetical protein
MRFPLGTHIPNNLFGGIEPKHLRYECYVPVQGWSPIQAYQSIINQDPACNLQKPYFELRTVGDLIQLPLENSQHLNT